MRNLKRALSLAVASVMLVGMMVVGTGASYVDVSSENNQEAIEVLQAVGIMTGDDNGNFNPDANVTRNEMAVIMCNLMDYTVSSYVGTCPFTDVPDWAEGYVAACWTHGITGGTSETTYSGDDSVTTAQAGLMLMKALGYFQYQSDFNSDWQVATVSKGAQIGIFDGVDTAAAEALTRNDVAQMVLNALEANLVDATDGGTTITGEGFEITTGNTTYDDRVSSNSDYAAISDDRDSDGYYYVQLGEDLYDGDLEKNEDITDEFGRPAARWEYRNSEIGVYAEEPEESYTSTVTKEDLYDLIGSTIYGKLRDGDADLTVYVDGETDGIDQSLSTYFARNDDDDASGQDDNGQRYIKRGALTQVFVDDDTDDVTIAIINTYVAQVSGDYDEEDGELDLDVLDESPFTADSYTLDVDDFDNLDIYSDEDYVLVTVASGEIQTIQPAEVITGSVTGYTRETSVTIDGERYYFSRNYTDAVKSGSSLDFNLNDDYMVVLDSNGYVLYTDGSDGVEDYVFIENSARTGGARSDLEAEAYFVDGINEVIVVDNDDVAPWSSIDSTSVTFNTWFAYDEKSNGDYELTAIEDENVYSGTVTSSDNGGVITENGSATVYVNDISSDAPYSADNYTGTRSTVRANNDTIFVVNEDDDISVYTGIREVPDITATSESVVVAAVMDGNYADVVYIYADEMSVSGDSGDRVYILDADPDASVDSDDNDYWEYDAIVNGEIGTVQASDDDIFTEIGLYDSVSYDSDGYVDDADLVEGTADDDFKGWVYDDAVIIEYSSGVLTIDDDVDIVLADSYTIFFNDDGDGKTRTPSQLDRDYGDEAVFTGSIYVYEDDNDEAVEVYVYDYATAGGGTTDPGDDDDDTPVITEDGTAESAEIEITGSGMGTITVIDREDAGETADTLAREALEDAGFTVNSASGTTYFVTASNGQSYTFTRTDTVLEAITLSESDSRVDITSPTTVYLAEGDSVTVQLTNVADWTNTSYTVNLSGGTNLTAGDGTADGTVMTFELTADGGNGSGEVSLTWSST